METHLRTLVMVKWVVSFVALGIMCQLLLLYTLLWTRLWPLALLYYTWWFTDLNTPYTGGRRSQWVRSWIMWDYLRDYFPVKLVKTCDLPSDVNLVLALHPHGVLSVGAFLHFATEATGFSRRFPGLTPHLATLPLNFRMPLYRDYIMAGGVCPATRASLSHRLSRRGGGQLVAVVVGGAAEALGAMEATGTKGAMGTKGVMEATMGTMPGRHQVALGASRGFLRLALTNGAWLVPAFSFGEDSVLSTVRFPEGSAVRRAQRWAVRTVGVAPVLFAGRSLACPHSPGMLPHARPITTVVGAPIPVSRVASPSRDEVEELRVRYTSALVHLFDEHKEKYGLGPTDHLVVT